jgi:glucose-1-phosphate cytidylyltransferase
MQVVILCGGRGTRLERETEILPKPMVTVGERPILWHIMRHYAHYGHRDFVLCLGYKGDVIKDYFLHYEARRHDVTVELGGRGKVQVHPASDGDPGWTVTLADTGLDAYTGARVKKIEKYIAGDRFLLTYGDGLADVDLGALVAFHRAHGRAASVTAVHPPARFGELIVQDGGLVHRFSEKPQVGTGQINGGFFVFERRIFDYLSEETTCALEHQPMLALTRDRELMAYTHDGFWQCMDTVRELTILRELWESGRAPWKVW